ncbi:MAG: alkaline phosphatase family protein [Kineosporiaceae bacterium]|nr:alkaline phosphatase family protein [Kineosporiaceae bacterium]
MRPADRLLVGPLLRHVDAARATIWVETDRPYRVDVRTPDGSASAHETTWSVHGHHYALVVLRGLAPGSVTEYQVLLDDEPVWPDPANGLPASVIRTPDGGDVVRLTFGSCRQSAPLDDAGLRRFGPDALVALAEHLAASPHPEWPDLLLLNGDQIYADEPSDAVRARLRERERPDPEMAEEIADFEEYTWLYHETWTEPAVRWLLSTVPSVMMLDDHDLRDDWNTSLAWREQVTSRPWWRDRVVGGLGSYWVYQHLGNLSPEELDDNELYRLVRTEPDDAVRSNRLDEFAFGADADPPSARWSVVRDLGSAVRLIVVDTRCSRSLDPDRRAIVDDVEWAWFRDRVLERRLDHLLVGSTLPVLLPPGIHHLEGWDEAVAGGAWGRRAVRIAENLRQLMDLEHWASFRLSLHRLCDLLGEVAGARRDPAAEPPASVLFLSGDIHSSYVARATMPGVDPQRTALVQLTMSPLRNPLGRLMRLATRTLSGRLAARLTRRAARAAGVEDVPLRWRLDRGAWFDNGVMTVVLEGRQARVEVRHAGLVEGRHVLRPTWQGGLTPSPRG